MSMAESEPTHLTLDVRQDADGLWIVYRGECEVRRFASEHRARVYAAVLDA